MAISFRSHAGVEELAACRPDEEHLFLREVVKAAEVLRKFRVIRRQVTLLVSEGDANLSCPLRAHPYPPTSSSAPDRTWAW